MSTQFYIGCKQVLAWPEERDGRPGYGIKYADGYQSWSPAATFESAYLPQGLEVTDGSRVTQAMVDAFIAGVEVRTVGPKTTLVRATLANGFELVESSSCVDARNYDEEVGARCCLERIEDRVWYLLGFLLQTARSGVGPAKG